MKSNTILSDEWQFFKEPVKIIKTIPIEGVVHKINDLTPTDLKKIMILDTNQLSDDLKKLKKNFEDIAIYIRIKNKSNKYFSRPKLLKNMKK